MANIIPFKAILPTRDKAHLVATRSYINYSKPHLRGKLEYNPFSFLHIINPDFFQAHKSANQVEKYNRVKQKFNEFLQKGYFTQDENPSFYLYRQIKKEHVFTGIIAGASVNDYLNGTIKIHEHTLTQREKMFETYLKQTGFNAEPVLMTHPHSEALTELKTEITSTRPEFDFSTTDLVQHQFWKIDSDEQIKKITNNFKTFQALYIADGHHRSASSVLLAKHNNQLNNPDLPINYFMTLFLDEAELNILPYHRLVTSIKPFSEIEFLEQVRTQFHKVELAPNNFKGPQNHHQIGMFIGGVWYILHSKISADDETHPTKRLDTQILNDKVFENILGIVDIKKDKRVKFLGGTEDISAIEKAVIKGPAKVGFAIHALNISDVKKVADASMVMPPKSTWVEPKLRSGLVIYQF